jgi:hypothetical protein
MRHVVPDPAEAIHHVIPNPAKPVRNLLFIIRHKQIPHPDEAGVRDDIAG